MSQEKEKFVLLTNQAGIPVVIYEKATGHIMPPHVLLSDPEANQVPEKTKEDEKKEKNKRNLRYLKVGILGSVVLIGVFIGYHYFKKKSDIE